MALQKCLTGRYSYRKSSQPTSAKSRTSSSTRCKRAGRDSARTISLTTWGKNMSKLSRKSTRRKIQNVWWGRRQASLCCGLRNWMQVQRIPRAQRFCLTTTGPPSRSSPRKYSSLKQKCTSPSATSNNYKTNTNCNSTLTF